MSKARDSVEDLKTLDANLAAKLPKSGGALTGAVTTNSTFDGVDIATRDGILTSTTATAAAALPKAGGTMTGVIAAFESTGIDDNATETAITIAANENVGIGVTPNASWNSNWTALQLGATGFVGQFQSGVTDVTALGSNVWSDGTYKYIETDQAAIIKLQNGTMIFDVAASGTANAAISFTTAMTITNTGQVTIGPATAVSNDFVLNLKAKSGQSTVILQSNNGYDAVSFHNAAGSQNGFIRSNASSVAYNTSSDYRLKENVTPISGATAAVKLLKPCNFDWIVGGNVNGFLAHELADVVPEAVTGTKDAMKDEEYEVTAAVLDAEGNETTAAVMGTRSVPDMQGIDQAKLVPLLTATIQELITRIEALEA